MIGPEQHREGVAPATPIPYERYEYVAARDLRREFEDEDSAAAAIDDVLEPRWRQ